MILFNNKNDSDIKSEIINNINSIKDKKLLKEIQAFLEHKNKLIQIKQEYGNQLYDTLNNKESMTKWNDEKKLYIELINLLNKLKNERKKNYGINQEEKYLFDINEPKIKELLMKSLFIDDIGLETWLKKLNDQGIRLKKFIGGDYRISPKNNNIIKLEEIIHLN